VRIVVAPLSQEECAGKRIVVTSPARTVVDCARTLPPRDALAIADAALRSGRVRPDTLAAALERARGWPGAPLARRVIALADGRRETALESWSAWTFDEQGLPAPQWQVEVHGPTGLFVARLDALWQPGVAGEADGRSKYRTAALSRGTGTADDYEAVLHEERSRDAAVRRCGLLMVRWGARDVLVDRRAADLAAFIRQQRRAAAAVPFEGSIRLPLRPPGGP
jgi:hypothetical protein